MSAETKYYWSGINIPLIIFIGLLDFFCVFALVVSKNFLLYFPIGLFLFLLLLLFFSITISVTNESVNISYGIGAISKSIPLIEIRNKRVVSNKESPFTLMYNIRGAEAIKLEMRDGKTAFLPTDNAAKLQRSL